MIYILVIWTVVGAGPQGRPMDWRPIGEFHADNWERKYSAKAMCERAAQELGLKMENYRCVRSK